VTLRVSEVQSPGLLSQLQNVNIWWKREVLRSIRIRRQKEKGRERDRERERKKRK
jgi:hypothetical protein